MNSRIQVPSVGQTRIDVSRGGGGAQLLIPDGCQVQSAITYGIFPYEARVQSKHIQCFACLCTE